MKTIRFRTSFGEGYKQFSLLSLITILYMCRSSCTNFAKAIGVSTTITAGLILTSAFCIIILYSLLNLKEIRVDGIVLVLLCAALFAITIRIHPEYSARFEDVYNDGRFSARSIFNFGAGIYTYYIFRMFGTDIDLIYDTYKPIPYIVFFLNLPTMLFGTSEYAMDFGYQMELAAIVFLAQYLHEGGKKKVKLAFSCLAMLFGVLYGARASILGYLVFIVCYLIWKKKVTIGRLALVVLAIIGAVVYNSHFLMMGVYNFFSSIGLSSRTLYLIATGDILASDYARQERIWPVLIKKLSESTLFKMYGAYGDRYYLNSHYPYAHNIALEILMTFGKFFGWIILVLILFNFVRTCARNKTTGGILTLALGCFSLCRLMVSSSFWIEPYFWVFLAMMVNCAELYKRDNPVESKLRIRRIRFHL